MHDWSGHVGIYPELDQFDDDADYIKGLRGGADEIDIDYGVTDEDIDRLTDEQRLIHDSHLAHFDAILNGRDPPALGCSSFITIRVVLEMWSR